MRRDFSESEAGKPETVGNTNESRARGAATGVQTIVRIYRAEKVSLSFPCRARRLIQGGEGT